MTLTLRTIQVASLTALAAIVSSCGPMFVMLPIETGVAFTNLSTRFYAAFQVRDSDAGSDWFSSDLLPPGATQRERLLDTLDSPCPDRLDVRMRLYQRVDADEPIGLDEVEDVIPTPIAAGEILDLPACEIATVETYTIVAWDTAEGVGRVKFAQATPIDEHIRVIDLFPNEDAVWDFDGVAAGLGDEAPPALAPLSPIAGRVVTPDGDPVPDVGVLIRTRFRVRLDDGDDANDPDAGFGDPIAFASTDAEGAFRFDRPAGAYRVEFFSDDFAFRPAQQDVETPMEAIVVVAEALP